MRIAAGFDVNFEHVPSIAVGVKHGNSCGAAIGEDNRDGQIVALTKMLMGDPEAIHGGIVVVNFVIDDEMANLLIHHGMDKDKRRILDTVVAPSFTERALEILARKKDKCRMLSNPALSMLNRDSLDQSQRIVHVRGGFLRQPSNRFILDLMSVYLEFYKDLPALTGVEEEIVLAWAVCSTSNSNTITLAKDGMIIANATGQQSRVGCVELALHKCKNSGHSPSGAVACGDSYFPFPDGPELLCKAEIDTIFAISGSINDQQTIDVCRENGVNLLLAPEKIARGFLH